MTISQHRAGARRGIALLAAVSFLMTFSAGCGGEDAPEAVEQSAPSPTSSLPTPANESDRVIANIVRHFEALNAVFARITDEQSAKQQVPEVKRLVDELHLTLVKGQALDPAEKDQSTARYQTHLDQQTQRFSENLGRLMTIPGASAPIVEVLESMPGIEPAGSGTPSHGHIDLATPPDTQEAEQEGHEGHDH